IPRSDIPVSSFLIDSLPTQLYTLSLHDALPISCGRVRGSAPSWPSAAPGWSWRSARAAHPDASETRPPACPTAPAGFPTHPDARSEEHTSELQSRENLVCRLLLEKKNRQSSENK